MNRALPAERSLLWGCLSGSQVISDITKRAGTYLKGGNYLCADPKVTQLHLASCVHQHIRWLHICWGNKSVVSRLWHRVHRDCYQYQCDGF